MYPSLDPCPCPSLNSFAASARPPNVAATIPAAASATTAPSSPVPRGQELLVTTDFSLEGIHFRREWHPPDSVGHRCLARGLSDIAAMGGTPHSAFLSLALPADLPQALG